MEKETEEKKVKKFSKLQKDILLNVIYAVIMTIYFICMNVLHEFIRSEQMTLYLKISSMSILAIAIVIIEVAYKKDSGLLGLYGIEYIGIAIFTLLIDYCLTIYKLDFKIYTLSATGIFLIYYILKSVIFYTKANKAKLEDLSDIKEIVKEEPVKTETKRKKKKENQNND